MPFLNITPSQVDIQLSCTLGRMTQDLLEYGRGTTGLYPECPSGVAEEVGGDLELGTKERKSRTSKEIRLGL